MLVSKHENLHLYWSTQTKYCGTQYHVYLFCPNKNAYEACQLIIQEVNKGLNRESTVYEHDKKHIFIKAEDRNALRSRIEIFAKEYVTIFAPIITNYQPIKVAGTDLSIVRIVEVNESQEAQETKIQTLSSAKKGFCTIL